jgi:hypothetical protein
MQRGDVDACVEVINHIISLGGSTAHEDAFDEAGFAIIISMNPKSLTSCL